MRLRKLLLTTGAIVAAVATTLVPTAQASSPTGGPIAAIGVGGNDADLDHTIALSMKTASVQIALYGITTTINCSAGSAGGLVHAGSLGLSPNAGLDFSSMSLTCPSIFPSTSVSISLACNVRAVFSDTNVHDGTIVGTDVIDAGTSVKVSNVDGALQATSVVSGTHCVQVSISNGCTFRVGGSAAVAFDETAKATNTQDLVLSGSGLQVKSPSGCLGAVTNNQPITLTATFNVDSPDGLVDFRRTPNVPLGGPIAAIGVGGNDADLDHTVALSMKTASATLSVYGIPANLTCTAGSASGLVHGGSLGLSPNAGFDLSSMSLTCPSIFPGTSASFSLVCNVRAVFDDTDVHDGTTVGADVIDAGTSVYVNRVDGSLNATNSAGTHCVQVSISNGCTFRVGGSTTAKFDETAKATNTQDLVLSGSGLQVKSSSGCLGAVTNNQPITLTATFNVDSPDGLVDFRRTPNVDPGGPIAAIAVGGNDADLDHTVALSMKTASATLSVYGIPANLTCSAGSAGGLVHGGGTGLTPNAGFDLSSMSLTCPSIFPGTSASFSLACNVRAVFDDTDVHDGTTVGTDVIDAGTSVYVNRVDGSLNATNSSGTTHCVQVSISNGCTFRIGGSAVAAFDEAAKATNTQDLYLSGSGLQVMNSSGCLGAVTNNQPITLTARFNVYTADGLIDFRQ